MLSFLHLSVTCDASLPYDPKYQLIKLSDAEREKTPLRPISRQNFIELCIQLTQEDEKAFYELWRRLGLSVDWKEQYSTINDHCRHMAQYSFLDLYKKGHIFMEDSP